MMSIPLTMTHDLEIRTTATKTDNKGGKITGKAIVYASFTQMRDAVGETFWEQVHKDALNQTLADGHDIFALRNHDWDQLIGRTGSNLTLDNRSDGLYFELTPPDTNIGRDLLEEVRTGLITGCSFGFRVNDQEWEERDGQWYRTIKSIDLAEVTLTPIPAYSQTSAEVRSFIHRCKASEEQEERERLLQELNTTLQRLKK